MNLDQLANLLEGVQKGQITVSEAQERLATLPFEDLGFAKVDHHRTLRQGFPEVIYCQNKTAEEITKIAQSLIDKGANIVLCSRMDEAQADVVKNQIIQPTQYFPRCKMLVIGQMPKVEEGPFILVVSGGTSDMPVAQEAVVTAQCFGYRVESIYDVGVAGLHRLLSQLSVLRSASVIIAVAGMEGALPSVVAGLVSSPVIAVPTSVGYGASFGGLSALLTMLNSCASGVSVVNIDNGFGAGYSAALMMGIAGGQA